MMLLRQLSYAIKNQLIGGFHARKGPIPHVTISFAGSLIINELESTGLSDKQHCHQSSSFRENLN